MVKIPEFKGALISVGNSKAFLIPAKVREDHGIEEDAEYWIELRLRKVEGGA